MIGSVNQLYEKSFVENWDRPAISNYGEEPYSYGRLARKIAKVHIVFEQAGLQKGDKVAICCRNDRHWPVAYFAIQTYGAVAVSILPAFKPATIHHLINHSDSKILFVDDHIWDNMTESEVPGLQVVTSLFSLDILFSRNDMVDYSMEHLDELFAARYPNGFGPSDVRYHHDDPEELAVINYTSGSTGFSKGVMIPYRALYSNIEFGHIVEPVVGNNSDLLITLPVAHVYGFNFDMLFPLHVGAHLHFLTKSPSPKILVEAMSSVRPHTILAVPLVIEKLYKAILKEMLAKAGREFSIRPDRLSKKFKNELCAALTNALGGRFEQVVMGGAPLNKDIEWMLKDIGFRYTVGYGMTECAPIVAFQSHSVARLQSVGVMATDMEGKVDSPDPENIPGELLVRGVNCFLGYYKNPEATATAFTEDGWMHTGDIVTMDSDGFIYIKGRCKCMILGSNGQNIYPEEIESTINAQQGVIDSIVIEDQGRIVALVYFDPAYLASFSSSAEISAMLKNLLSRINDALPDFSRIARIEVMPEDFERTPKGSIKRYLYQR